MKLIKVSVRLIFLLGEGVDGQIHSFHQVTINVSKLPQNCTLLRDIAAKSM